MQINNRLNGTLPQFIYPPGNTNNLASLDLSSNFLTGQLPIDYLAGMLCFAVSTSKKHSEHEHASTWMSEYILHILLPLLNSLSPVQKGPSVFMKSKEFDVGTDSSDRSGVASVKLRSEHFEVGDELTGEASTSSGIWKLIQGVQGGICGGQFEVGGLEIIEDTAFAPGSVCALQTPTEEDNQIY